MQNWKKVIGRILVMTAVITDVCMCQERWRIVEREVTFKAPHNSTVGLSRTTVMRKYDAWNNSFNMTPVSLSLQPGNQRQTFKIWPLGINKLYDLLRYWLDLNNWVLNVYHDTQCVHPIHLSLSSDTLRHTLTKDFIPQCHTPASSIHLCD